jgi:hypothetical protein
MELRQDISGQPMTQVGILNFWLGKMQKERSVLTLFTFIMLFLLAAAAQTQTTQSSSKCPIEGGPPAQVVEQIWLWATEGELLTRDGWSRSGYYFSKPTPYDNNKFVQVISNSWGPAEETSSKDGRVEVYVGFWDLGRIDAALHFVPAPKTEYVKMATLYYLVPVPKYTMMYAPDGKTLLHKNPTGSCMWQIEGAPGSPWTTVNTAIRYVMDAREKAPDEAIRKNADQTLSKLRLLH